MWITILVMAIAVSLEPFRIGMTVLMLNRPRPLLQLFAFLCGGFAMGMTVGLVVLFVFRQWLGSSTYLTLSRVQILIGAAALLVGAALIIRIAMARGRGPRRGESADRDAAPGMLLRPLQRFMDGRSLSVAAVAGFGIALPSVDYLAALAVILASGTSALTQVAALLTFNVVAFVAVEIPFVAYWLAPGPTSNVMTRLNNWIRSRRELELAVVLVVLGCVLLGVGIGGAS
ncbi:hypothetical protein A5634_01960 [Mycobacterium asiaticum]|uniref:Gap protein n=1 Tax=Mycobacterium asiaticum TaxID=1790 RepID=A0A1A3NT35_MYCAS|nr:GAP family protein [Mycobacterium asiaticum]OBK25188.1 hypothetical protein A5634_01960 [Mycobacterium asiaticum]